MGLRAWERDGRVIVEEGRREDVRARGTWSKARLDMLVVCRGCVQCLMIVWTVF